MFSSGALEMCQQMFLNTHCATRSLLAAFLNLNSYTEMLILNADVRECIKQE